MKVLQVNCVYGNGSTGKITQALHRELLARGIESVVCYGRGEKIREPGVCKICGEFGAKCNHLLANLTGLLYGGCFFSTNRLIRTIRKEQPDIVHLQCLNGYFVNIYRLVSWLKRQGIQTVLTLHAEFMYTANCGHALDCPRWLHGCGSCPRLRLETESLFFDGTARSYRKMQQAFAGFGGYLRVVSVSPWLQSRAEQSPILAGMRHFVVFNGIDTEIFHPWSTEDLRKQHGLRDEIILFHATPFFSADPEHLKGGCHILRLAERFADANVKIFVAGDSEKGMRIPGNVILLGRIQDPRQLARYYSMADVTVLTSRKEAFSMVTAESLCCGTPVAGFQAGGPEQIAPAAYARFVKPGDETALFREIGSLIGRRQKDFRDISEHAKSVYSKTLMTDRYMDIYLT